MVVSGAKVYTIIEVKVNKRGRMYEPVGLLYELMRGWICLPRGKDINDGQCLSNSSHCPPVKDRYGGVAELFLHCEVSRCEPVSVAEDFYGVVAGGEGGVDIPVNRDTELFIGIFHRAFGS